MIFPKIFTGVRVIDFSRLLPGPFASMLLSQMGAEVTCILPPQADPLLGAYSPFKTMEAGKSFLTLDLKRDSGKEQARALIREASILLEGFRPGTLDRLGFSFEATRQLRPDILYVSIVGYSPTHPKYLSGAHDLNFLVDSGLYSLLFPDSSELIPALQLADVVGGFYAAFRILAEWTAALAVPQARRLEVSIVEGLRLLGDYLRDESVFPLLGWLTGGLARYHIYFTRDQKRVAVCALEPKFYENLLRALGLPVQEEEGAEMTERIQKVFAQKNLEEWKDLLKEVDACLSFIPSREEVLRGN